MDFLEVTSTITYYTFFDLVSEFGGLYSTYKMVVSYLGVFFIVHFMYQLSITIKNNYKDRFRREKDEQIKIIKAHLEEEKKCGSVEKDLMMINTYFEVKDDD